MLRSHGTLQYNPTQARPTRPTQTIPSRPIQNGNWVRGPARGWRSCASAGRSCRTRAKAVVASRGRSGRGAAVRPQYAQATVPVKAEQQSRATQGCGKIRPDGVEKGNHVADQGRGCQPTTPLLSKGSPAAPEYKPTDRPRVMLRGPKHLPRPNLRRFGSEELSVAQDKPEPHVQGGGGWGIAPPKNPEGR
eukprot:gene14457-biopygen18637